MSRVEVVAPNLKSRLSGVTSTIVQLVPIQQRSIGIATIGPGLPDSLPKMRWWQLPALLVRPASGRWRIWHARRNVEMVAGLLLRWVFRAPVRLLFTSAAQREHQGFTKWLIRNMDAVIATSARSGAFLDVPHTVVMHGVDLDRFHPPAAATDRFADSGLPGRYAIGCFGRVRHQKGTDLFVDAMIALLPEFPDWTAIVTGRVTAENRDFANDLERRVHEAGLSERIRLLGEVPDIRPWYRRLSLYVAPSRNEGFGLTPLEAMASGSAVVASDAGAFAEMVLPGETGDVVAADDGPALTAAIRPYLADPSLAQAHGRNALAHVRQHFPLVREADGVAAVYNRLWAMR
ncbi:MAG: glycosyltransferase family 4 protein [Alphaproteobacteria bacterium]|nr:glycosyltransferase family 4 protein [Alphaproteobacteria bacterium]MBU0805763.1 glycosyltransferase family 4 protein [Alphaproteobacteria bacterium]MBU0872500.1 glycosyltransferase family 4 protein [Alphaproteobacteria bacterium]MBU1402995.1 glycosyltransferase family 4 protein [Alphaproteobacteria bacterium]MBU1593756.1 glycosyltransferase family 4 protein [Alphaproteobacteria bacterium]